MIRFRTSAGVYAVPIERAVAVRGAAEVLPLPSPAAGVAGVLDLDGDVIPVVGLLGGGDGHVLVVAGLGGRSVGLLTHEVTGLADVASDALGPPPPGQRDPLVSAVARFDGDTAFVVDVDALAARVPAAVAPAPKEEPWQHAS
jgi:chemotaxis signal transduction protein